VKRFVLTSVLLTVAFAAIRARAQEPASNKAVPLSKVVRLNRAPVNKQILEIKLPRPRETKLSNGLTVLVLERHKLPTVAFTMWIKTGAMSDPKALPGLAGFTADMAREGTAHLTSAQLAAAVDDIGASLGASADFGSNISTITASGLVENTDRILELMSDMALNPSFPPDELDKYKKRQLAALQQERAEPGFLGRERFFQVLYRDFPASVVSPTPASVEKVTVDDLKKFHDEYYVPDNAILGVTGDVAYDQIVPLLEKYFGSWKSQPVKAAALPQLPPPAAEKVVLVDRPGSVQTNILAGDYSVKRSSPDYIPLVVTNRILGGGPASRLFLDLREEKGLTYGAYSYFEALAYPGPWMAQTEVRTAVTDQAMQALMDNFKKIQDVKVPENELDDARRSIVARFALSLEQPATLLDDWLLVKYYGLSQDYWDNYPAAVAKVDPAVVQETAKKYVDLNHLQFVCVGDGKQIKDVLKKYGPLEVYDADGKRQE
jgi:zinc protease